MLIQFSVTNYRSFRKETTLSLVAAKISGKGEEESPQGVFSVDGQPDMLTAAVIFGANASGKSNFLSALYCIHELIVSEVGARRRLLSWIQPFRLNQEQAEQATTFEIVVRIAGTIYRYGISVNRTKVVAEWLYSRTKTRETTLFERGLVEGEFSIKPKFGRNAEQLRDLTREDVPFLSVAADFNVPPARALAEWMGNSLAFHDTDERRIHSEAAAYLLGKDNVKVVELIKQLDLSIVDASADRMELESFRNLFASEGEPSNEAESRSEDGRANLLRLLEIVEQDGEAASVVSVATKHRVYDKENNPVTLEEFDLAMNESDGTQRLFVLAGAITKALETGGLLVIDELDSRVHTHLARLLIQLFQDPKTNPKHAQLICTTHDTNLLDSAGLRRDQIWFTDKNYRGESSLYSLVEFRGIRNDKALERAYLKGEFGAVPIIKEVKQKMVGADVTAQAE